MQKEKNVNSFLTTLRRGIFIKILACILAVMAIILIPVLIKQQNVLAQTKPYPVSDGTYYYWESSWSDGPYGAYQVNFYWITDLDGNAVSGAGYYEESSFGYTISSGYMDMGRIMNMNELFSEVFALQIILGIAQGT